MPKIKTNRAAAKRFKKTGTGKLKRNKAYKSHILTKKSQKRKRNLRKATITDATNEKNMKNLVKNKQFQRRSQPKFKKKKILTILNLK